MSIDPLAPFNAGANGFPPNAFASQPFPPQAPRVEGGYPPPPGVSAPFTAVPSAPGTPVLPQSFADYGEVPDVNSLELRDYSESDSRLKVHNKDPGLDYYWCNSDADRMATLYRRGWRIVRRRDAAASDDQDAETPRLRAGTQRDGQARRAILLCRPKYFSELQREKHRRMVRSQQATLDPRNFSGNSGKDAGSFRGHIAITAGNEG